MSTPFSQNARTAKPAADEPTEGLGKTRRRLSVVSDNKLVEGLSGLATGEDESGEKSGGERVLGDYAGVSKKGYAPYNPRKKNQDILIMEEDANTGMTLLAVFDGHGEAGDGVSQFFKTQLPPTLFAHPQFAGEDRTIESIQNALTESVAFLEKNLLRDSSIDTEFSGTTAVFNIIWDRTIICGNIGDSRITLGFVDGTGTIKARPISDDHKPDRKDEKARIVGKGGRVFAVEYDDGIDGPFRVWLGHMDVPGLAMARSLGDTVAHSAGVISDPEYTTYVIGTGEGTGFKQPYGDGGALCEFDLKKGGIDLIKGVPHTTGWSKDLFLVIASDGLWEFMTDQEVIDICKQQYDLQANPRKIVDLLIMEANGRWMKEEQVIDDTTVIVAFLNGDPK